ncbi:hypothetical protein SAMN02910265_02451 [Ruminococcus flavefaciens]|uniref:Uncharacterized protein n=1 Tax=Ruminococcus flavefaciens TaxID=1265 RepID=A0A1H6KRS9_RUMFL|nr:hypothetical protein [Ruminococcus flavefaciens]SEH74602.1 hypothetical protein SAMN02910265_02451 [Ruminococcus flavefaciens]
MKKSKIEQLSEKEYIVVDFLPQQVHAESSGQFFAVENLFLHGARASELRRKFSDIILKLYCYYGIEVFNISTGETITNPKPELLDEWIISNRFDLQILIEDSMVMIAMDDTHITLYDPSDNLTEMIRSLARSEGLFVWKPPQHNGK